MDVRMLPLVDKLRTDLPVPTGWARDDTGARPARYKPDCLYAWALSQAIQPSGDEAQDQANFVIRIALSESGQAEVLGAQRLRAVSSGLDDAARAVADWPRTGHRQVDPFWDHLGVSAITYDAVIQADVRVVFVDLAGYRFTS